MKLRVSSLIIVFSLIAGCRIGPTQTISSIPSIQPELLQTNSGPPNLTLTQTPTSTSTPTATKTPTPTPTQTLTPSPIPVQLGSQDGLITMLEKKESGYGYNLVMVNPDGLNLRVLSTNYGAICKYAWSPDGKYLGFTASLSNSCYEDMKLYLLEIGTSKIVQLTDDSIHVDSIAWHPNSDKLVISTRNRQEKELPNVYIVWVDQTPAIQLPLVLDSNAILIEGLNWSPSGEFISLNIIFLRGGSGLYLMNSDGSGLESIGNYCCELHWISPRNDIAISNLWKLSLIDLKRPSEQQKKWINMVNLIDLPYGGQWAMEHFAWSPDRRYIAFRTYNPNQLYSPVSMIQIISSDGSKKRVLTDNAPGNDYPTWSPDSKRVAYVKCTENECDIYKINIDGLGLTKIVSGLFTSEIKDLTWENIPEISLKTSFFPPTPTPLSMELLPTPPLYDNFEGTELDRSKWQLADMASLKDFSYRIGGGVLQINSLGGKIWNKVGEIVFNLNQVSDISQIHSFEARLKILSSSSGVDALLGMVLNASNGDHFWRVDCRLGIQGNKSWGFKQIEMRQFNCYGGGTKASGFSTRIVPINLGQWYRVRMDINPNSGAIIIFLDDHLIGIYYPEDADFLIRSNTLFSPSLSADFGAAVLRAQIDDVRLGTNP